VRRCPECGGRSHVVDSRERDATVWRRRKCVVCHAFWSTWESPINTEATTELALELDNLGEQLHDTIRRFKLVAKLIKGKDL